MRGLSSSVVSAIPIAVLCALLIHSSGSGGGITPVRAGAVLSLAFYNDSDCYALAYSMIWPNNTCSTIYDPRGSHLQYSVSYDSYYKNYHVQSVSMCPFPDDGGGACTGHALTTDSGLCTLIDVGSSNPPCLPIKNYSPGPNSSAAQIEQTYYRAFGVQVSAAAATATTALAAAIVLAVTAFVASHATEL